MHVSNLAVRSLLAAIGFLSPNLASSADYVLPPVGSLTASKTEIRLAIAHKGDTVEMLECTDQDPCKLYSYKMGILVTSNKDERGLGEVATDFQDADVGALFPIAQMRNLHVKALEITEGKLSGNIDFNFYVSKSIPFVNHTFNLAKNEYILCEDSNTISVKDKSSSRFRFCELYNAETGQRTNTYYHDGKRWQPGIFRLLNPVTSTGEQKALQSCLTKQPKGKNPLLCYCTIRTVSALMDINEIPLSDWKMGGPLEKHIKSAGKFNEVKHHLKNYTYCQDARARGKS